MTACGGSLGGSDSETDDPAPTYTVTYQANGATGGLVPVDATNYAAGQTVTIRGNTGVLVKSGSAFTGWNTKTDGTGTTYTQGQSMTMGTAKVTLYAKWTTAPTYTVDLSGERGYRRLGPSGRDELRGGADGDGPREHGEPHFVGNGLQIHLLEYDRRRDRDRLWRRRDLRHDRRECPSLCPVGPDLVYERCCSRGRTTGAR